MREILAYLSHSLGEANGHETVRRYDNMANAGEWLSFLVEHTGWMVIAPWHTNVTFLREIHRPRAYSDQLRILARCDALVMCGEVVSPHMTREVAHAHRNRVAIIDLTDLGHRPPEPAAYVGQMLDHRLQIALTKI